LDELEQLNIEKEVAMDNWQEIITDRGSIWVSETWAIIAHVL